MLRQLVTEKEIVDASKSGKKNFEVDKNALITAAAKDRAFQLGISLSEKSEKKKEPISKNSIFGQNKMEKIFELCNNFLNKRQMTIIKNIKM